MASAPIITDFVMYGARTAMADGLSHIEEQVKGIERAVVENPALAFDLAKTVVESACRTILSERKIEFGTHDDLPQLFKIVANNLPLLPVSASAEVEARRSLAQTLNGLHTALHGVCELRNAYGFAAHGKEWQRPAMESAQAVLAAQAADVIVGFLYRVHRQERNVEHSGQLEYVDNEAFNSHVDDANEQVQIFDLTYRPSEVLFAVDQNAYRDLLTSFEPDVHETEGVVIVETTGEGT